MMTRIFGDLPNHITVTVYNGQIKNTEEFQMCGYNHISHQGVEIEVEPEVYKELLKFGPTFYVKVRGVPDCAL